MYLNYYEPVTSISTHSKSSKPVNNLAVSDLWEKWV